MLRTIVVSLALVAGEAVPRVHGLQKRDALREPLGQLQVFFAVCAFSSPPAVWLRSVPGRSFSI